MIKRANKWDKRFVQVAELIRSWSKDPSTQVGAVAVNAKRQIISTGYNGFPRGIRDLPERYESRELKYRYVLHAEQNLISNSAATGVSLNKSDVYVVGMPPCERCSLELIQSDIRAIIVPEIYIDPSNIDPGQYDWLASWEFAYDLFVEAGVEILILDKNN